MTEMIVRHDQPTLTPYEVIERVITSGDLSRMDPEARVAFYWRTCESLGLNPLTQPFSYLVLDGKVTLYAKKDATEQLRRVNRVSVTELRREHDERIGAYTVWAHGRLPDGREDEASGVVSIKGLSGQALANALMKAETKAKRRLTLSLIGLGFLDESEVEGQGQPLDVDVTTGEIHQPEKPSTLLAAVEQQIEALATQPADESSQEVVSPTEPPTAPEIMAVPMSEDESAEVRVDEVEDEAELLAQVDAIDEPGLTIQQLADLAREHGVGKLKFAGALEILPADVGKRIEGMTDQERYQLGVTLGLVRP